MRYMTGRNMSRIPYSGLTLVVLCYVSLQFSPEVFTHGYKIRGTFTCKTNPSTHSSDGARNLETCISGQFDAITTIGDDEIYAFKDELVVKLDGILRRVAPGYPQLICDVFPGIPSSLDAALHWHDGKTYFFKGRYYWVTNRTQLENEEPRKISDGWPGLPNDLAAALMRKMDNLGYFFKGSSIWQYNSDVTAAVKHSTSSFWAAYGEDSVDATFQGSNGRIYFFKGDQYWSYDDNGDGFATGYPLLWTEERRGCAPDMRVISLRDKYLEMSCRNIPELDSCISGKFDAITRTSDGKTYAFKDNFALRFNDNGTGVAPGYPKAISCVFPGIPSSVDAALYWRNGITYFFKGSHYWATNGTKLEEGYPRNASVDWPGIPSNLDAAVVWGWNEKAYFFKGSNYWRFSPDVGNSDQDARDISTYWHGYGKDTVDAAFQWNDGQTYIFDGEEYWRYDDNKNGVAAGYPLLTSKEWLGCTTDEPVVSLNEMFLHTPCNIQPDSGCSYWVSLKGSSYCFSDRKLIWTEAVESCRLPPTNGHLVTIEDENEYSAINYIRNHPLEDEVDWRWISVHDRTNEGVWTDEDGEPITYQKWLTAYPSRGSQEKDCAFITKDGYYVEYYCYEPLYFICER